MAKRNTTNSLEQLFASLKGNKRNSLLIVILLIAGFLGIFDLDGIFGDNNTTSNDLTVVETSAFNGSNFEVLPKEMLVPVDFVSARDGDTIVVELNNHRVNVRYLIIDTPEMNYDTHQPDPFAEEAKEANINYLTQADQVYLEFDVGPYTDNYDRALAYVYADEIFVNEALVEEGLATVRYLNPPNVSREQALREAERNAQDQQLNIWE